MKRTMMISGLLLTGIILAGAQEKIRWYTIEEAVQLSRDEPRIMVIDVYTDWCGWCKRMDATTFEDPEVVRMMNDTFYPVKLNAEGKEDIIIGDRTFRFVDNGGRGYHEVAVIVTKGQLAYPTVSFLDGSGKVLEAAPGYRPPDLFKRHLSYYRDGAYKTMTFDEYSDAYRAEL